VESGAFTVTSTIGSAQTDTSTTEVSGTTASASSTAAIKGPCPRFGSLLAIKQSNLFLYGGTVEDGNVTYTLRDFYSIGNYTTSLTSCTRVSFKRHFSLDLHKWDEWEVLIEPDQSMEWIETDSSTGGDSDDETDEEESEMEED